MSELYPASGEFAIAMHPGAFLEEAYLEPLGLTAAEAAAALGVTWQSLSAVVHGHRTVSAELALKLDVAFGASAEGWLNMQRIFDLNQARKHFDLTTVKSLYRPAAC